jgi:arsenate reductase (thioredoxin)
LHPQFLSFDLAEATFNHLAPEGWPAMSAGCQSAGRVHPRSLALLECEGISTEGLFCISWNSLPATPDIVITVCDNAAGETRPTFLNPALRTHWGAGDPARATVTEEEINATLSQAYRTLCKGIETVFALPLEDLRKNSAALRTKFDYIGIFKSNSHIMIKPLNFNVTGDSK